MRWLVLALLLLTVPVLAGCTETGTNPGLRPPCAATSPVRVDILTDKASYLPGEVMNVTLLVNNTGSQAANLTYRSWELTMRTFDGTRVRTYYRDEMPGSGGTLSKRANPGGVVVLQARFQPFPVSADLFEPLPPGTYYLCAVVTGAGGENLAAGAEAFVAERPPTGGEVR